MEREIIEWLLVIGVCLFLWLLVKWITPDLDRTDRPLFYRFAIWTVVINFIWMMGVLLS
jgi:low temperature requirement protein LtrA